MAAHVYCPFCCVVSVPVELFESWKLEKEMSHSVLQVGGEVRRFGKLALLSLPGNARIPDGR